MNSPRIRARKQTHLKEGEKTVGKMSPLLKRVVAILLAIFCITLFVLFFVIRQYSNTHINIVVAGVGDTDPVRIYSFYKDNLTLIEIPSNTIIRAANNLGNWPARSLWKLGVDQGVEGQLMARSVTKTFSIPITDWSDKSGQNLGKGFFKALKFAFSGPQTSLPFSERVALVVLNFRIDARHRRTVNLANNSMLSLEKNDRGEEVYFVREKTPVSILKFFDEPVFSSSQITVGVEDGTESNISSQELSRLVSVIGGRVVSVDKTKIDGICTISGREELVTFLLRVLPCTKEANDGPFDIKIKLGKDFPNVM